MNFCLHRRSLRSLIGRALLVICLAVGSQASASHASTYIDEPETELALIKTSLDQWLLKLNAEDKLNHEFGIGPQNDAAERAWANANEFFGRKEWTSSVRELNNFLNQLQVPDGERFLRAQYMLGIAYEGLQFREKSIKAYFRYLAATLTAKQERFEELLDVLRRLVPLVSSIASKKELRQQLAALTSLELPPAIRALVFYYASKAAIGVGDYAVAEEWLKQLIQVDGDAVLKARAMYLLGVIAIQGQKSDAASEFFGKVIALPGDDETRDLARLALARLAFKARKSTLALRHYDTIAPEAASFKDATFESIYVLMDVKREQEARVKSLLYLSRWPEGPEAMQVRILLPYLDMRVGDLAAAQSSIAEADKRLQDIKTWLQRHLANESSVTQTTLEDLTTLTGAQLAVPTTVQRATQLYVRLAELSRRLSDIRGSVRNTLYTVGRAKIVHFRPFWLKRSTQLDDASMELLQLGHRLIETERRLYASKLSRIDQQRLDASFARRASLLGAAAKGHRQAHSWEDFTVTSDMTLRLASVSSKLAGMQAELASVRYVHLLRDNAGDKGSDTARIEEHSEKVKKLQDFVSRGLEAVRRYRTSQIADDAPHIATMMFFQSYAGAMIEEELILSRVRGVGTKTSHERLNAEDASGAWAQWRFLASMLFDQLSALDRDMRAKMGGLITELDLEENSFDLSDAKVATLSRMLSDQLGQSMAAILNQYQTAIDERFARHQKIRGDLDYLKFLKTRDDNQKLQDQYNLEQQILRDNLLGLQQGALWQWPN
ncbi:MAG: hypothetical protein FJ146_00915 [Deltaproteobacteria bacterium]|nr:hypothetical protein [Deltaproteobacteria bacterium]